MQNDFHNIERYLAKFRVKKPAQHLRIKVLSRSKSAWETRSSHGFTQSIQNALWWKWAIAAVLLVIINVFDNSLTSRLLAPDKSVDGNYQSVPENIDFLQGINGGDVCLNLRLMRIAQINRKEVETDRYFKNRLNYLNEYNERSVL